MYFFFVINSIELSRGYDACGNIGIKCVAVYHNGEGYGVA